jgi:hypothetical protein
MLLGLSAEDEGRISKSINGSTDPESMTDFSVRKRMGLRWKADYADHVPDHIQE